MQCDRCAGDEFTKAGRDRQGRQRYRCTRCGRRLTPLSWLLVSSGFISHTHNTSSQDSYEAPFFNCP
jgi:DNA-directed RNA polymerase subunit RPC12/RpoP